MFHFYLRQTVPFNIADLLYFPRFFLKKNSYSANSVEKKLAEKIGTKFAVMSSSMRTGMLKSLEYFNKKIPGKKEVILPEYSFHSNLSSVLNLGLKVKYVPVDPQTLEIDLEKLPKLIAKKTLAIIITHIHGLPYPMKKLTTILKKKHVVLFEDCAHVFGKDNEGKKLGSFGIGCFSFGAGKNITGFGGGAICTNDRNLYQFLKKQQKTKKSFINDVKTFLLAVAYTFISNPFFSFFTMKPLLGISFIANKQKTEKDKFVINKKIPKEINTPSNFQLSLIYYQLEKMYNRIQKIVEKRKKIANIYSNFFMNKKLNRKHNFYFQYPICADNKDLLIKKSWLHNLDVRIDYCSYLPDLYKSNKLNSHFNKNIVHFPVNYHMSTSDLKKRLIKIFKNKK